MVDGRSVLSQSKTMRNVLQRRWRGVHLSAGLASTFCRFDVETPLCCTKVKRSPWNNSSMIHSVYPPIYPPPPTVPPIFLPLTSITLPPSLPSIISPSFMESPHGKRFTLFQHMRHRSKMSVCQREGRGPDNTPSHAPPCQNTSLETTQRTSNFYEKPSAVRPRSCS